MTTKSAERSRAIRPGSRRPPSARSRGLGLAQHALPVLVAVTLGIALTGGYLAIRIVSGHGTTQFADGRVATSFGAVWVDSVNEIVIPKTSVKGHVRVPEGGKPDKVSLEVRLRFANTTAAPVELTPALFALRLGPASEPISVEASTFESVRLLPGAVFDARLQFPVKGGEHQLSLLFADPDAPEPITIELGAARFPEEGHQNR